MATLAEYVSNLSVWVIGLVAAIYFLQKFESELKPLVVAFIFVSILESSVQWNEWCFQKSWAFTRLICWKTWQVVGVICISLCGCGFEKGVRRHHLDQMWIDVLYNWRDLRKKWESGDAGKNYMFRVLSVIVTLGLVGLIALMVKTLVQSEVASVTSKIPLYRGQIEEAGKFGSHVVNDIVPEMPHMVPRQFLNQTEKMVSQFQKNIGDLSDELPGMAERIGIDFLNAVLHQTTSSFMFVLFFMLYSAFMLFDPLHINFETDEKGADASPGSPKIANGWASAVFKRSFSRKKDQTDNDFDRPVDGGSNTQPLLGPDQGPDQKEFRLLEVQQYIYRIVWQYVMLTMLLNAVFAGLVWFLLQSLGLDLAVVLAVMAFLLSFIPELGAVVATLLPVPFILLTPTDECRVEPRKQLESKTYFNDLDVHCMHDFDQRLRTVIVVIIGILCIKLLVSNLLSAYLMGSNKWLSGAISSDGEVRETHGVLVLFAVVFCGKVWGVVGMLISVPLLSVVRLTFNMGWEKANWEKTKVMAVQSMRSRSARFSVDVPQSSQASP